MNKINFFQKQKENIPYLKWKVKNSFLQKLFLIGFLMIAVFSMNSQTAPNVSYATPQNYLLNTPISTLTPVNVGGSVPALNYKQVSTFAGTTSGFLDGTGTAAKMDGPLGMTMDASGNVYFVDSANFRIRKMTPAGVVTTIAGDGYSFLFYGRLRNNAVGSAASFSWPSGIVLDTANNCLYVADKENDVIRKVSLTGTFAVTTFAGSGTSSSLDGKGTAATFKKPNGIAIDPTNTYLYVTDRTGNKIRRITISDAQVLTIAGSGTASTVDNATGTSATFNEPTGIAVDANFIYVSDFGGNKIRRIASTAPYAVITFAGSGTASSLNGMGIGATLDAPFGITLDGAGNLFVAEWGNKIRKITPDRMVTTIAGLGNATSVDGNGTAATLNSPSCIVINPTTSVAYVSEWTGDRIRKIELGGYTLEIELGGNYEASSSLPAGLTLDILTGNITGSPRTINNGPTYSSITAYNYYGSSSTSIAITTGTIPTLTVTGVNFTTSTTSTISGNVSVIGGSALLEKGVCWSTSANPTISDSKTVNNQTDLIDFLTYISGLTPYTTYYVRSYATNVFGTAYGTEARFNTLMTLPSISYNAMNTFAVNTPITALQVSSTAGPVPNNIVGVTTFAGIGSASYINGAIDTTFLNPRDIVKDTFGNLFVLVNGNNAVRKITPSGTVSTYVTYSQFNLGRSIAIDANNNLYVSTDGAIYKISQLSNSEVVVAEFAGGYIGETTSPIFEQLRGLTFDTLGNLYVADYTHSQIKKITPSGQISTYYSVGIQAPISLAFNSEGVLYVSQASSGGNTAIVKCLFSNGNQNPLASIYNSIYVNKIYFDVNDDFYVSIEKNIFIQKNGNTYLETVCGNQFIGSLDGSLTSATFNNINGFVKIGSTIYVADTNNNKIRQVNLSGYSVNPALPSGLVLNADGSITGTPTIGSVATNYTVTATNAGGSSTFNVRIRIVGLPALTTKAVTSLTATTVTTGGIITAESDSVTASGICYRTWPMPTIAASSFTTDLPNEVTGGFSPTLNGFTTNLSNLSPLTTYYIRAYATNSVGTVYGPQVIFTTLAPIPVIQYTAAAFYPVNTAIAPLTVTNTGGVVVNSLAGVSTFAGSTRGYTDGTTDAQFSLPYGVVKDSNGNLFVIERRNNAIRKITSSGTVSTFAGGNSGAADGLGTEAQFLQPFSIAIDSNDNLYVSDTGNNLIRKITPSGLVNTLAGTVGTAGFLNGTGTSAQFNQPCGLTVDASGNVYVADSVNNCIRKITPTGVVSTYFTDLSNPVNIAFNSTGSLFVSQIATNRLVKLAFSTGIPYKVNYSAINFEVQAFTFDKNDNIYMSNDTKIFKSTEPFSATSIVAGTNSLGFIDGSFQDATFNYIRGLTIDNEGIIYVADATNNRIRKISPFGYSVLPSLPAGLVLNTNGSITGTPTVATIATDYVVTATNSGGSSNNTINFAITTVPSLTTTEASLITATTASLGGTVTSDGYASVTARGLCWSTSPNPTTANSVTTDGTGTGIFVSAITGLSPVTAYYVRAYATNSVGTVYGNEFSFTTVLPLPVIQYTAAATYNLNTAIIPLTVTNTGGVVINSLAGVSTFAGSIAGYTDGTTNAQFSQPSGVVTDSNGNLFVTDSSNNAIRKITPSGTVSTFAGGTSGTADGIGTAAQFFRPNSIAIDANDNLYISDTGNHLIRKITPSGLVSTLAGTAGTAGFVNGTGTSAQFNRPYGLTLDVSGNVYVADNTNNSIRKITPAGVVSTYFVVDYMLRTLDNPTAVAFDSAGNLFVSQVSSNGLVKIIVTDSYSELIIYEGNTNLATITFDKKGTIYAAAGGYILKAQEPYTSGTLFAGSGQGFADGTLLEAKFGGIRGLTIDNEGVMYVADGANNKIRKISPFGYIVSPALPAGLILNADGSIIGTPTEATAATDYVVTATNSGGSASYTLNIAITTVPSLTTTAITSITATSAVAGGTVLSDGGVSVTASGVCWSTSPNPTIVDTKTTDGTGTGTFASSITGLTPLTVFYVRAYATNGAGTAYGNQIVVNTLMYAPNISYISTSSFLLHRPITTLEVNNIGGAVPIPSVTTLAGTNGVSGATDGIGSGASFNSPQQMATDSEGNIYLADVNNHRIRKITALGVVTTLAGGTQGDQAGNGVNAKFNRPLGVAVDTFGNVYVADSDNHKIKKIDSFGDVTTIAGSSQGFLNGTGSNTKFDTPKCITLDASGNLYVTDSYNHKIRKITPAGLVTTFAGSSFGYQEGNGTSSQFYYPSGITKDAAGNFYVADGLNHKIRKITSSGDVTTLAGSTSGILDGIGTAAKFSNPQGISIDPAGNIYVTDFNYQQIRKVTPNGIVTTLAGNLYGNINGQSIDGSLISARFAEPIGVAVGLNEIVYVSDRASNVIRKMQLAGFSVSPNLPDGLTLNNDGSITGTPFELSTPTDYIVTATNAGGSSSYTISITVEEFVYTAPLVTVSQNNVLCNGGATGSATAIPSGGQTPYTYSWINLDGPFGEVNEISTNATVTGLHTGNYLCIVRDAINNGVQQQFFISQPSRININENSTNPSCLDGNDGSIALSVSGGTAPYTYSWAQNFSTSAIATGLSVGRYNYTIIDANGCVTVGRDNVYNPSQTQSYQDACGSYTWSVTGQTYTTSGTYTSVSDCNPEILYLTVTPGTSNTTTVASCDSYTWSVNGTTYTASGTYSSGTGCNTETLNLTIIPNSIVFTTQPVNTSICNKVGVINLIASISPLIGAMYQWKVQTATGTTWDNANNSSVHYSGATTPVLNIQQATAMMDNNKYKLVVTAPSACSSVSSDTCVLTVNPISLTGLISGGGTICENSAKTLRISNWRAGTIQTIQWQASTVDATTGFTDIEGATGSIYTTDALTATTYYRVVISSGICNSRTSPAVTVTVIPAPVAGIISGGNVTVCAYATSGLDLSGTETPFSNNTLLSVAGTTGAIQWQKSTNYENASGATPIWASALSATNELTVTDLTADTWFRVLVTNSACSVTSDVVKITVSKLAKAGVINSYSNGIINSASICIGGDISFISTAFTGTEIKWEVSTTSSTSGFEPIADSNGPSLTMDTRAYAPFTSIYVRSVVRSGDCSIAISGFRKITVSPQSVAGTVTGGGTICLGANGIMRISGFTGVVQWQSSVDGITYVNVPTGLATAGNNYSSGSGNGISGTYIASNITADTYFRAKITSGICSEIYSNAVQFTIGTASAGTLTAADQMVCRGTGTTLTLTGSVGSIKWFKSTNWTAVTPTWTPLSSIATTVSTGYLSVSTAYKAEVTIGSCSIVTTVVVPVMVYAAPLAKTITANVTSPTGISSTLAICNTSTSKVLTIGAGSVGAIQWQRSSTSSTSGFVDITDATATSYTVTNPAVGANYFRAKFTNSCGASVFGTAFRVYYKECTPTKAIASSEFGKTPFAVVSHPNPFTNNFNLDVTTSSSEKVEVLVYDIIGRLLEKHQENVSEINTLEIGTSYPAGVYNIIVTQGMEVKTIRVIKK